MLLLLFSHRVVIQEFRWEHLVFRRFGIPTNRQIEETKQTNVDVNIFSTTKKKKSVIQKSMWMTNDPTIGIVMKPVQLETGLPSSSSSTKKNYFKKKTGFFQIVPKSLGHRPIYF